MWTRTVRVGGVLLLGIVIGQLGWGWTGSQAQAPAQVTPTGASSTQAKPAQAKPTQTNAAQANAAQASAGGGERTVWYFYTVKWGKQDEFLDLFQKNHYPILAAQIGTRLAGVRTYAPTYHGDGRADWTFAVQITFKDAAALTGPSQEEALARTLFPDQEKFRAEERERFDLLQAHWDVPLTELDFKTRRPVTRR